MLDLMFLGSRAPWGRSEDRCDGDGSEADGAKPPVKPGPMLPVLGVLVFPNTSALVIPPSSGFRIHQARRWPGRSCPAYRIGFAPWIGGAVQAWREQFFPDWLIGSSSSIGSGRAARQASAWGALWTSLLWGAAGVR